MTAALVPDAAEARLLRREGLDTVAGAFAYAGGRELAKPGLGDRRRIELNLRDDAGRPVRWYLKLYGPAPWPRRLGRRLLGRGFVSPARREYENIRLLQRAGVATMEPIAYGEEVGAVLGVRRSYIVVSAVPGEALERCLAGHLRRWDQRAVQGFNAALVELVRRLHRTGCVHRDLYASHIFLDVTERGPELYLIDLARLFAPRWRLFRWRVKDLAELKYSMPAEWVERHWRSFLESYLATSEPGVVGRYERAIEAKVSAIRRHARHRAGRSGR